MAEKRNSRQGSSTGLALLGLGAVAAYALSRDGFDWVGGGGGGGIGGDNEQTQPQPQQPEQQSGEQNQEPKPVEETAPTGPSGDPQTQTISSGSMTGPDEETTMDERSKRREMFSSTDDPDTIADRGNSPEESDTISSETMSGDTATERGQQREAFASTEDPSDIIDDDEETTSSETNDNERQPDPVLREGGGITGGGL